MRSCVAGLRSLIVYPKDGHEAGEPVVVPLRCKSFRCPVCRFAVAREDFRRIEVAATSRPDWYYAVLTLDPKNHRSTADAYRDASDLWRDRLLERLRAEYGRVEYLVTVEQHLKGMPHWNVLMRSEAMLDHVRALGWEWRDVESKAGVQRVKFYFWRTRVLAKLAPACGWGERVWGAPVVDRTSMALYFAKIVGEFCRAADKTGDQRPVAAPLGTRRLRASSKLLPPRKQSTGQWGAVMVDAPVHAFLDRTTGELAVKWSDVELAKTMRAVTIAGRERLEAQLRESARRWAELHALEIVPKWGDPQWSRAAPMLGDLLAPVETASTG